MCIVLINKTAFQDIETFDLEDFKYNSVNITAFRLVDAEDPKVSGLLDQMEKFQPVGQAILNSSGIIQVGISSNSKNKILKCKICCGLN